MAKEIAPSVNENSAELFRAVGIRHVNASGLPFTRREVFQQYGCVCRENELRYSYDANGNRSAQTSPSGSVNYTIDTLSNKTLSATVGGTTSTYARDANGSLTNDGSLSISYDAAGRVASAGTGTYAYNGLDERVSKTDGLTTTQVVYDESGRLIGEYNAGMPIQETVWLGDMPLAVLTPGNVFYIHTDQLNTPRQIDDASQSVVWSWDTFTFGGNAPSNNPSGALDGVGFSYNLRFPGQYADIESGLNYNWHRLYDAKRGAYTQADPLGLRGGSWSLATIIYGEAANATSLKYKVACH